MPWFSMKPFLVVFMHCSFTFYTFGHLAVSLEHLTEYIILLWYSCSRKKLNKCHF